MAVTYATALKTARMNAVVSAIDAGSGAGKLQIGTSAFGSTLVTITLDDPCATVSGAVLTLADTPLEASASASGTAAVARIRDSDNNDIVTGLTVGTSGTDIILDSTSITSGQTVRITAGTITHG